MPREGPDVSLLELLRDAPLFRQSPLAVVVNLIVFGCFLLVALAVIADFRAYHRRNDVVAADRSWVETGSMTTVFIIYYAMVRFRLLEVRLPAPWKGITLGLGLALMIVGAAFNVLGRLHLKSNWANQIRIYEDHWLVTTGPFSVVRHPLYASLIWMLIGGVLVYANLGGLILTLVVFVPMMYARARKEDALLAEAFGERFETYRRSTGMLLPRLPG